MKTLRYISVAIILLIVLGWVLVNITVEYVAPGQIGVLTRAYGIFGEKGVVKEDFNPGWHWKIPPIHHWVKFDGTVQTLEMTRDPHRGSQRGRDDVQVQSADGYAVSVDVTVKYRIMEGKAHKVYQDTGSGIKYQAIVRNEAQEACMRLFGQMKTEDFYNPEKRRHKAEQVQAVLTESLQDNFVEVIDVLIRDVQFDPEYEKKIQRKKLADQEVELNKSQKIAYEMKGKTQLTEAETKKLLQVIQQEKSAELVKMEAAANRKIAKIKADYERYATEKRADADLIAAQNEAKGSLLMKQAEAEGEKLRNQAMQGVGGSTIVALEAARNLNLRDAVISSVTTDLLDVDAMATKLGVENK